MRLVTLDDFRPLVGQKFEVALGSGKLDLILIEACPIASPSSPRPVPFSLLFRGPLDRVLDQRIYPMEQASLSALDVFLVPVGNDDQGLLYEAVFN
jgi:hypothetical protein